MEFILCSPQMFLPFLHEERQVVGRACERTLGHVGLFHKHHHLRQNKHIYKHTDKNYINKHYQITIHTKVNEWMK